MAEIYNRTLVETKAAMLLIPKPAGVLANNRLDLYDTLLLTETWSVDNKGRWLVRNSAASTRI